MLCLWGDWIVNNHRHNSTLANRLRARDVALFTSQGFLNAGPVLTDSQRLLLLNHLQHGKRYKPAAWFKGRAVTDRLIFDLAADECVLAALRPLIGDNIILWGASLLERQPGQRHGWHVDIESAAPEQRFASIWVGLRNTFRETGLKFISGSHLFPKPVQEIQHSLGTSRDTTTDDTTLAWARELDASAALIQPDVCDGEAIIFDGRIWHGSHNDSEAHPRTALLLQYASADSAVRMPVASRFDWPFRFETDKRPPVILVSGTSEFTQNLEVPPPPTTPEDSQAISTELHPLELPLPVERGRAWQPHPLFSGMTEVHDHMACHASVLAPGEMPHPPHSHIEEEILMVLDGDAELLIGDGPDIADTQPHPVRPGMFVYYPAFRHHTLRNVGAEPLTYLMFKWRGSPRSSGSILDARIVDPEGDDLGTAESYTTTRLANGETSFLSKLKIHRSDVQPGGGYEPHRDEYDVAIVVLSGKIKTLDREVGPFGVIYYAAGEMHGLRAVGPDPARYVVFEFRISQNEGSVREKLKGAIPEEAKTWFRRIERASRRYPRVRAMVPRQVKSIARAMLG